jgi:hypothetical protein
MQQMGQAVLDSGLTLFDVREAVIWRTWGNRSVTSDKTFYGANPPNGAIFNFYLKEPLAEKETLTITIQDAAGQTVRAINCTRTNPSAQQPQGGFGGGFGFGGAAPCNPTAGVNRYVWDLRSRPAGPPPAQGAGAEGGFMAALASQGLRVDPGTYTVKIKRGDSEQSKTFSVIDDPRVNFSADDRAKKRAALTKLQPLVMQAVMAQQSITSLRTNVNNAIESWKRPGAPAVPDNVKKAAEDFLKKIDAAYVNWGTPPSMTSNISQAGPPLVELPTPLSSRVIQLMGAIENTSAAPTEYELSQIDLLSKRIPPAAEEVRGLVSVDLPALNQLIVDAKVPYIPPPTLGGGGGRNRGGDTDMDDPDRQDP